MSKPMMSKWQILNYYTIKKYYLILKWQQGNRKTLDFEEMIKQENKPLFYVLCCTQNQFPQKLALLLLSIYLSKNIQNPDFSELLWWVKVDSEEQRVRQAILARASFILLQLAQRDHAHIRLLYYTQWTRHVKKCNLKDVPLGLLEKNVKDLWF